MNFCLRWKIVYGQKSMLQCFDKTTKNSPKPKMLNLVKIFASLISVFSLTPDFSCQRKLKQLQNDLKNPAIIISNMSFKIELELDWMWPLCPRKINDPELFFLYKQLKVTTVLLTAFDFQLPCLLSLCVLCCFCKNSFFSLFLQRNAFDHFLDWTTIAKT